MKLYAKNAKDCGKYVKGQAFSFLKCTFEKENLQFLAIFCNVEEEMKFSFIDFNKGFREIVLLHSLPLPKKMSLANHTQI